MVPQKASGGRGEGGGSYTTLQLVNTYNRGGNFFFFFFFFEPGVKLDEKSIENGLEGQKFLVVCLFWGGCHHPNTITMIVTTYLVIDSYINIIEPCHYSI